jgi:plastocyanin
MTTLLRAAAASLALLASLAGATEVLVYVTTPDGRPAPDTVVVILPLAASTAPPSRAVEVPVISQKDIRFWPQVSAVPLGTTVRFVNRDRFDHHVKSVPGGPLGSIASPKDFEFRLPAARGGVEPSAELKMDAPGAIAIGCHLHGSMRAHIYVSPTPWVAVTNAAGRAVLSDVPEGAADVRLWHPDQLVAQVQLRTEFATAPASLQAQLNFTPRRRNARPPGGDYERYPN